MGVNDCKTKYKDYDNSDFYNSKTWRRVSQAYLAEKNFMCERCGRPATLCHHKKYLDGKNVHDPDVALNFDNLEALCQDCHNAEHGPRHNVALFDRDGNIAGVKDSRETASIRQQRDLLDVAIANIKKYGIKAAAGLEDAGKEDAKE